MNLHTNAAAAAQPDPPRPDENGREDTGPVATNASHTNEKSNSPHRTLLSQSYVRSEPATQILTSIDTSRLDAVERDDTRPDAANRDETRPDATGCEGAFIGDLTQGIEETEPIWIDVDQAAMHLRERGISRTIRTIQRMCKRGDFVARLVPTETGVRYIINDRSIDDFVTRHNEQLPSSSYMAEEGTATLDMTSAMAPKQSSSTEPAQETPEVSGVVNLHLREIIDIKDQQIVMLQSQMNTANEQITVKDEQIATMLERDHETNVLIQNLQNLVALPQGRSTSHQNAINVDQ